MHVESLHKFITECRGKSAAYLLRFSLYWRFEIEKKTLRDGYVLTASRSGFIVKFRRDFTTFSRRTRDELAAVSRRFRSRATADSLWTRYVIAVNSLWLDVEETHACIRTVTTSLNGFHPHFTIELNSRSSASGLATSHGFSCHMQGTCQWWLLTSFARHL